MIAELAVAAALTVANVVRLAANARRDEIEIMQLVGAPFAPRLHSTCAKPPPPITAAATPALASALARSATWRVSVMP